MAEEKNVRTNLTTTAGAPVPDNRPTRRSAIAVRLSSVGYNLSSWLDFRGSTTQSRKPLGLVRCHGTMMRVRAETFSF
jgi:hypothetical protein